MDRFTHRFSVASVACRRGERLLFADLSFDLAPGEALLLTGPNGAGKSSLLRLLAGLLPPAAGTLGWDGAAVDPDAAEHRRKIAWVGHLDALKPLLTARENLLLWAALAGAADGIAAADAGLAAFRLAHLGDAPARLLSAGQRRRLALARLVAAPAALWLLDEPGTALDRASLEVLAGAIAGQRAAGGLVVLSTHGDLAGHQALDGAQHLDLAPAAPAAAREGAA